MLDVATTVDHAGAAKEAADALLSDLQAAVRPPKTSRRGRLSDAEMQSLFDEVKALGTSTDEVLNAAVERALARHEQFMKEDKEKRLADLKAKALATQ